MPTADQHRRKAEKNLRFLTAIDVGDHPEWAATVAFYIALHRVEQLRAVVGDGHSADHTERLNYVRVRHTPIYDPLDWLYRASRLARYGTASDFFARYDAEAVRTLMVAGWLAAVEGYVASHPAAPPEAAP